MPRNLLTACTNVEPEVLARCAQLLGRYGWPADLLPALRHRDALRVTTTVAQGEALALVADTWPELKTLGLYEVCLLHALTTGRTSYWHWKLADLHLLVMVADQVRLRAAGEPLPEQPSYVLYRGVAGKGRARHIRGLSWTASLEQAWWFARRWPFLPDPAVYMVHVPAAHVWTYINRRQEDEYVLLLPPRFPVRRMRATASGD
jgi:hypothetical protein